MTDTSSASGPGAPGGAPHTLSAEAVLARLGGSVHGLERGEAAARLARYGPNTLPRAEPPGLIRVFLRQFLSPLIYILLIAAAVSLLIDEHADALFIMAVLLVNAIIGTIQEFSAQRAATALQTLVTTLTRVLREGDSYEVNAEALVPGDVVLLESGDRVPADLRLLASHDLEVDESLLTGESAAVRKRAETLLVEDAALGDRVNMGFAGTLVTRGRGHGVVVGTALDTELGRIAAAVLGSRGGKAPLLVRMQRFTYRVAIAVGLAVIVMAAISVSQGTPLEEIFLLAVALAVSAIPEGLPVALTVALAIGMRRMAARNVIVRRLVAVEALGSCTFVATDKTGTLTVNQLTVTRLVFPAGDTWQVTGEGMDPRGALLAPRGEPSAQEEALLRRLSLAAVLPNDGLLAHRDGAWTHHGDAVDVALLVMAHKAGVTRPEASTACRELETIPFESERRFAASLNQDADGQRAFVKGALESLLPMCSAMATTDGDAPLDEGALEAMAREMAQGGYRVLALASGPMALRDPTRFSPEHLQGLTLLGLVGMIDPLRPEAKAAVTACRSAGIEVAMVTGDHPETALAIARELDLASQHEQVVTGPQIKRAQGEGERSVDALTRGATVFARVEPQQKLDIVHSLQRNGHFVAVSGDGANDAPALRAAQVGVAMGKSGTDVARETAELIVTDDNFASIVAGVEEGRIAYGNVRKVIFLLISTGAAELVLFALSLAFGLPLPLMAVQLLWLNLVTNGIQDVALAFEPGEGHELKRPPRPPRESIFNRLMIERVVLSAITMGMVAFVVFEGLLAAGASVEAARNETLLLMVLFENVHVFNSRSETRSAFLHNPLRNPLLLFGTLTAQLVHIGAMYVPGVSDVLGISPVSLHDWANLLLMAFSVMVVMELHKLVRCRLQRGSGVCRFG